MNRIKKNITVRFFSVETEEEFFSNFAANFVVNQENNFNSRIFNLREKKYLIKTSEILNRPTAKAYSLTVVRERNTWQTKATRDGKLTGISLNQGIIGDPYFFLVIPKMKMILGFTSGPSGSLKSVAKIMLEQFSNSRTAHMKLNFIPKEKEFKALNELTEYNSLHFKIDASSLSDVSEDAPQLIKELSSAPYIDGDMQLSLDLEFNDLSSDDKSLSKDNVIEIVNFLSDHDGCTVLKVKGLNNDGIKTQLDFGNAFFNYKTEINTRNKFIDEQSSSQVLGAALTEYIEYSSS